MTSSSPLTGDALLTAVSDSMAALHEQYHGRAPATAKTQMLGDDLLACVLGRIYSEVEMTMIELERNAAGARGAQRVPGGDGAPLRRRGRAALRTAG